MEREERGTADYADERKRREVDPTLAILRECLSKLEASPKQEAYTVERLGELKEFFETTTQWYGQVRTWPLPVLRRFLGMGDKVLRLLGMSGEKK